MPTESTLKIEPSKDGKKYEVSFELPAPEPPKAPTDEELKAQYRAEAENLYPSYAGSCNISGLKERLNLVPKQPRLTGIERDLRMYLTSSGLMPTTLTGDPIPAPSKRALLIGVAEAMAEMLKEERFSYLDTE